MNSAPNQAKQIFLDAIEKHEPDQWPGFLDGACGDDQELRRRVEVLLQAHVADESLLDAPAIATETTLLEQPGTLIGPYKLLQQIGVGGMGVVYMAEQTEPIERRVALKIIKPGMDTRHVIARFEAERQALAMMDHPNIAKALDAGVTDTGRPYFVMELVKGVPITEYCDEHKLAPRERLKLFVPVCQAIQHAHQKGIIHRDIKPSNVLIANYDDRPVPKVIDFGVAKAIDRRLTEKTMFTEFGQVLGTVEYMSPEQAKLNQWDVDTRSDIYSLGVLLYELLSGETPFDRQRLRSAALDELLRVIREEEPPRPSMRLSTSKSLPSIAAKRQLEPKQLSALVHGELDWIVMKSLEKDRTRRYETASKFAEDVQHYLNDEPVEACPPSAAYRFKKFTRRNKAVIATFTTVAAALLIGTGVATWQAYLKTEQSKRALIAEGKAIEEAEQAKQQAIAAQRARDRAEKASKVAKYWQYISNIPAVDLFLSEQATGTARNILKNTPPEYRNFEWGQLANRAWPPFAAHIALEVDSAPDNTPTSEFWKSGTVKVVQELFPADTPGGILSGYFAPDGRSVFVILSNGLVKEISIVDSEEKATYKSEAGSSLDVVLSPTGTRLAGFTFSNRGTVWPVDPDDGEDISSTTSLRGPPWLCRWTPDEKHLLTGHMNGKLRLWDAASLSFEKEWDGHESEITDIYLPTSGDFVWSASNDGKIIKRNFPEGQVVEEFEIPVAGELLYQAISPSGTLACAVYRDGSHLVWDIQNEQVTAKLGGPSDDPNVDEPRIACNFSPDESCVAVLTSNRRAAVYDVATGDLLCPITGNGLPLRTIRFSPGGKLVLTLSFGGPVQLWSCIDSQGPRMHDAHDNVVYQLDVDANDTQLLLGSFDSTASVWNLRTNRQQSVYRGHDAEIMAVDLHPEGKLAATLDATGKIHVWNTDTATSVYQIDPESGEFADHIGRSGKVIRANLLNFPASLSTGIFTPNGKQIVAFHQDRMKVFDALTGVWVRDLENAMFSGWPICSFDSSLVAILEMYGKSVGVWDLQTGELRHRIIQHQEAMVMVDFSPVDLRIVTGAMEAKVNIWDAMTGKNLQALRVQSGNVISCHFSQNGQHVLTGYNDNTARVWDANTGQLVTTLVGHSNRVRDVRFNPDQTRLLSWSMDNRAIIWDLAQPNANQLLIRRGDSKLIQARWTADGRDVITAWSNGNVKVWRGSTKEDIAMLKAGEDDFETMFRAWQMQYTNALTH